MYEVVCNFSSIVYYKQLLRLSLSQLLRLGSFDHTNMSTCVAQSAQRRNSIPDITGSNPQAAIRHNTFK